MKKSWFFILLFAVIALISSCEKVENVAPPTTGEDKNISVFFNTELKSGREQIQPGDTISLPRDINIIFSEEEDGKPVNRYWLIMHTVTEFNIPITATTYFGDQIANQFTENGYYEVSINLSPNTNNLFKFYVFVGEIPGKLGDNQNIFRMETRPATDEVFLYYKYFNPPTGEYKAYVILTKYDENDLILSWSVILLSKWQFSNENYYCCSVNTNEINDASYIKLHYLISSSGGYSGYGDDNNFISSWTNGEGIVFVMP